MKVQVVLVFALLALVPPSATAETAEEGAQRVARTIEGIDHINSEHHRKTTTMLLIDRNQEHEEFD